MRNRNKLRSFAHLAAVLVTISVGLLSNMSIGWGAESAPGQVIVQLKKSPTENIFARTESSLAQAKAFHAGQIASILEIFNDERNSGPGNVTERSYEGSSGERSSSGVGNRFSGSSFQRIFEVRPFATDSSFVVLQMADDSDTGMSAAISKLKSLPEVKSAEPNQIVHAFVNDRGADVDPASVGGASVGLDRAIAKSFGQPGAGSASTESLFAGSASTGVAPNDPDFSKTWAFQNTGQADPAGQIGFAGADIGILPLWNAGITGSKKVVVAVLDSGIDLTHPDLAANIYTNPGETAGNGVDDDHNGFVDDVHGWNFFSNNNNAQDDNDHGTHVAGMIGAVGNNGVGIAGVNWSVSLLPVKFLGPDGSGLLSGAIEAINYATLMKAQVINMSSGVGEFSQAMSDAITAAQNAGILFVAAAGNTGVDADTTASYPASYALPNMISVAATDNQDHLASFSDYGMKTIQIAAPGVDIYSTILGGQYATYSGTSMATPLVSGVAALLLSQEPTLTASAIKDRLMKSADPIPALHRKVASQGRLNAYNALHSIYPPSPDPDPSLWQDVVDDVESPHPYANDSNLNFTVQHKGARYLRLHFQKIDTELYYDVITVTDATGKVLEKLSGQLNDYTTDYVEGDTLNIQFTSDHSTDGYGFLIDKIQVIE